MFAFSFLRLNFVLVLDILYTFVLYFILNEVEILITQIVSIAVLKGFGCSSWVSVLSVTRFLALTYKHGVGGSQMYLSLFTPFLELSFRLSTPRIIVLALTLLVITFSVDTFGWIFPFENEGRINVNIATRLYVLCHFVFEILLYKHNEIEKEKKLKEEANLLEEMEKNELGFMRRFSHFSKTSLNGIINFLFFLRSNFKSKKRKGMMESDELTSFENHYEMIEFSSSDIIYQTNNLVNYYQSRHGSSDEGVEKNPPNNKVTDVREILDYVLKAQKRIRLEVFETKKYEVRVSLDVHPSVPPKILLDPVDFLQILNNTISNAFKYTSKGSVSITVGTSKTMTYFSSTARRRPGSRNCQRYLYLRIKDTGKGIKKEMMSKLFDPYVKNDEDKEGDESFSIGLFGVKNTLDRLNGTIHFKSEGRNRGTTCLINIPCCTPVKINNDNCLHSFGRERVSSASTETVTNEDISSRIATEEEGEEERKHLEGQTETPPVLIVEDNIINQKVFRKQVEEHFSRRLLQVQRQSNEEEDELCCRAKMEIYVASNGKEGLAELSKIYDKSPIILCDVDMPEMNGIEFIKNVRRIYQGCDKAALVVFCVTATIIGSRRRYLDDYGFDGIDSKPVNFEKMGDILSFLVRLRNEKLRKLSLLKTSSSSVSSIISTSIGSVTRQLTNPCVESCTTGMPVQQHDVQTTVDYRKDEEEMMIATNADEEEEKEKRKKKMFFMVDILVGFISCVTICCCCFVTPEDTDLRSNWNFQAVFYCALSICQYLLGFLLGFTFEFNSILSNLKNLLSFFVGSVITNVVLDIKIGCLVPIVFIAQSVESVESFRFSLVISVVYIIFSFYYEITRDQEKHLMRNETFVTTVDRIVLYFIIITSVLLVVFMRYMIQEKKRRLQKIIQGKRNIEKDNNNMMSRISHDLATPAQTLLCHLQEVGSNLSPLFQKISCEQKRKHKKQQHDYSESYLETFRDLSYSSIVLECSIRNFLICCKLRNRMIQTAMKAQSDIKKFINSLVKNVSILRDRNCDVVVQFDEETLKREERIILRFDMINVQLIIMNLIINALVHSKATRILIKLSLQKSNTSTTTTRTCNFSIEDNGIGIRRDILDYLDEYDQKDGKSSSSSSSSIGFHFKERFCNTLGLGLIVSRCLSNSVGGEFELSTRVDEFTKISFSFPFENKQQQRRTSRKSIGNYIMKNKEEEEEEEEGEGEGETTNIRLDSFVLLVDDQITVLTFLKMYMKKLGFSNVVATNQWREAVEIMQSRKVDLLITDYKLDPKVTAVEMIQKVEKWGRKPMVTIVASGGSDTTIQKYMGTLFDGFIPKPILIGTLRGCLESLVSFQ